MNFINDDHTFLNSQLQKGSDAVLKRNNLNVVKSIILPQYHYPQRLTSRL